jgi:HK97 family phage major capsid protein
MAKSAFKPADLVGQTIERTFSLSPQEITVDPTARTVRMALTSDEPILHSFNGGKTLAYIILDHKPESIDFERFNAGAPMTENHDLDRRLGRFRDPETDGHVFRATGRFSPRPYSNEIFDEVQADQAAGDLTNVSAIVELKLVAEKPEDVKDGIPVVRCLKWKPIEGSIVSSARDITGAGVGRAATENKSPVDATAAVDKEKIARGLVPCPDCGWYCSTSAQICPECGCEEMANLVPCPDCNHACSPTCEVCPECGCVMGAVEPLELQLKTKSPATVTARSKTMPPENEITAAETRIDQFTGFAAKFGSTDATKAELMQLARSFALENKPFQELGTAIIERLKKWETNVAAAMPVELTDKERKTYSISRAILTDAERRMGKNVNCFELEVSAELERKLDAPGYQRANGFLMPTGQPLGSGEVKPRSVIKRAGLDTATGTHGQELVFIEPGGFIDMLRTRARVIQLGATVLPGLQGNVAFPRQTGAGTFSWVGENPGSDVAESDLALDQVQMSPHTGMSRTQYSRQLLRQGVVNVDNIVQNDLVQINARGVDKAALHGTGSSNQPKGLYAISGVNSEAFGGPITYDHVVSMETKIAAVDADVATMAYLFTPEVKGKAKITPQLANTIALPIWNNGEMNGYRAESTNQLSKTLGGGTEHGGLFGAWEFLYIGEWGALEILTDPYTLAAQGMIRVITFIMVDIAARYEQAFTKATGLTKT